MRSTSSHHSLHTGSEHRPPANEVGLGLMPDLSVDDSESRRLSEQSIFAHVEIELADSTAPHPHVRRLAEQALAGREPLVVVGPARVEVNFLLEDLTADSEHKAWSAAVAMARALGVGEGSAVKVGLTQLEASERRDGRFSEFV